MNKNFLQRKNREEIIIDNGAIYSNLCVIQKYNRIFAVYDISNLKSLIDKTKNITLCTEYNSLDSRELRESLLF